MQKEKIHRWTLILFILILLSTSFVQADGGYFSRRAVAVSADQRAIIIKNGDEISITFSTGYTGEGEDFGWIIPTPVPPAIEDVSEAGNKGEEAFQMLDKYTAPTITVSEKSGGCFPSGTQVLTSDGPRAIETVNPGTNVYSYDLATGDWILKRVLIRHTLHYEGDMIAIQISQDTLRATGNHPFYVLSGDRLASRPLPTDIPKEEQKTNGAGRWVEARDLKEDDILQDKGGEGLRITSLSSRHEKTEVHNLEVEGYHNYAVHRKGILVHNKGGKEKASEESSASLVTVYGTVTLEHYEVSVVKTADASALLNWLRENDYQVDPAAKEILDDYIDQNWAFVAVKLNPSEERHYENEFLPPLTIIFRHSVLIFPLRISSTSTIQTAKIVLYVIAESTVTSSNLPTTALRYDSSITEGVSPEKYIEACIWKTLGGEGRRGLVVMWRQRFIDGLSEVVMWQGGINREEGKLLRTTVDALMKTPFSGTQVVYLTRLETRMDPASMTDDIKFILDSKPQSFMVSLHANKGYDSPVTSKETKLIAASQVGEKETVKSLLATGVDVDAQDEDQRTALMMAVRSNHTELIQILLEAEANVNVTPEYGETALMSAVRLGNIEVVKILLDSGAEVNSMPLRGETALMKAAASGHIEIAKILLEAGTDVNASAAVGNGWTVLMRAAGGSRYMPAEWGGHAGVVRMLLESGADVNARDSLGETALMWAADGGHTEVVRILLEAGADVNALTEPTKYYSHHDRTTALFSAARRGYSEIVKILVRAGADSSATTSAGESALITAAGNGHTDVVRILVEAGADVSVSSGSCTHPGGSSRRRDPLTALMWASSRGHTEVVRVLIEAGADVNARTPEGRTAMALAKKEGHFPVANLLAQAGANE